MKKVFVLFIALSLFVFSCGKKAENTDGTHVHDDGSMHADHETDTTKQEEFKVAGDSTEHGHDHEHNDHD
jgi:hypothetical protein